MIVAFKKAAETLTTQALLGTGVPAILLRIGTVWGPLSNPASPFIAFPRADQRGGQGRGPSDVTTAVADYLAWLRRHPR